MKGLCAVLASASLLIVNGTFADTYSGGWDAGPELGPELDEPITHFWEFDGHFDYITPADFDTPPFRDTQISYSEGRATLSYTQLFGCDCDSGLTVGGGYATYDYHWNQNPEFHRKVFNKALLDLSAFTLHFPCWQWKTGIEFAFDVSEQQLASYTLYTFYLAGRYELYDGMGVHMGFIASTGIRKDKIWPIIGIDFWCYDCWKINLIYPTDLSILYQIDDNWSTGWAHRIWWSINRVSAHEPDPRGIFEYRNEGDELRVVWEYCEIAKANIHAGYSWGGDLIIANQKNKHSTHYKFDGAAYAGLEANIKF